MRTTSMPERDMKVGSKLSAFVKSRVNNYEFSAEFWIMRCISANHPDHNINVNGCKIPYVVDLVDL